MPDYNPKDVPTLDDIIEKDITDNAESDDAGTEAAKNDLDLSSNESIDPDTDDTIIAETEPQTGDLNDIPEVESDNTEAIQSVETTPQVSVEPIAVELIVKDIVKQLLPDLEQQLTFLLQQALEEKLPEKIIKPVDTTQEN